MTRAAFLHRPTRASIDGFEIDVSIRELPEYRAEVTRHPVETGLDITDAVQIQPEELEVEWLVTDHPIGRDEQAQRLSDEGKAAAAALQELDAALVSPAVPGHHRDAAQQILELFRARRPVDIVTAFAEYTGMVIESVSMPRDAETQSSLLVTLRLVQVRMVDTVEADIDPAVLIAVSQRDQGRRETRVPQEDTSRRANEEYGAATRAVQWLTRQIQ